VAEETIVPHPLIVGNAETIATIAQMQRWIVAVSI
jgi:hypothetical protein